MICETCNHVQDAGKFCGKCGGKMIEAPAANERTQHLAEQPTGKEIQHQTAAQQAAAQEPHAGASAQTAPQPAQPNVNVEKVKETSKAYWNYFLHYLKRPSLVFQNQEQEFRNGLISIGLFAVLAGLVFYTLAGAFIQDAYGSYLIDKPDFIPIFLGAVILSLIFMAIVAVSLFGINKYFGPGYSFKEVIGTYGTHVGPLLIVLVLSLLLFLVKAYTGGIFLLIAGLGAAISLVPLYIMSRYLTVRSKGPDALYAYLIYIVLASVLSYIVISIMADSAIGNMIGEINDFNSKW